MIPLPGKDEMERRMMEDKIDFIIRNSKEDVVKIEVNGITFFIDKNELKKEKKL